MKATINGIQVEGTPEEVKKYQELVGVQVQSIKPCDPPYNPYNPYPWGTKPYDESIIYKGTKTPYQVLWWDETYKPFIYDVFPNPYTVTC